MKIGSLFSGYGGLDAGVRAVIGGELAWHVEFDPAPSKILAHHYPDVPNYGDVTAVDWAAVEPVDVLTGGFPCQDVSLAGRRAGMKEGTRSGLWSEFARAISVLRPGLVVIENVRGLLSADAHSGVEPCSWCVGDDGGQSALRALGAVLGDLAELGYDAEWCGVRAADAGAPHGRFRVFIVAYPGGRRGWWRAVAPGHGSGSGADFEVDGPDIGTRGLSVENTDCATGDQWWQSEPGQATGGRAWADAGGRSRAPVADSGCDESERRGGLANMEGTSSSGQGGKEKRERVWYTVGSGGAVAWGDYEPAIRRWEAVTSRPAPAPTLPDGRDGQHRLSAPFVEWMMGLPSGWVTAPEIGLTRREQLKALGNGVVPQQAALALRWLL